MVCEPEMHSIDRATRSVLHKLGRTIRIMKLTLDDLIGAVAGNAAAFRCRRRLQPAGGEGDKVFPPTYAGGVYAVEMRRVAGHPEPVTCVLLDSVQSQANRMELALHDAQAELKLPVVVVDFSEADATLAEKIGRLTSLQVPHRLSDAILRDSNLDGKKFRDSEIGRQINAMSTQNATPLFEFCPTALVFGMWDSTGPKGGLGAKFERAVVSEAVGVNGELGGLMRGVRRDPLEIRAKVLVMREDDGTWSIVEPKTKGAIAPSEINHGSVPFPKQRDQKTDDNRYSGVTIEYAEQITTLSLICLRSLRFPVDGQNGNESADVAARTVLAALGLCAATLAFENGLGLRSRCLLWPDAEMKWELLDKPGQTPREFKLDGEGAKQLLVQAISVAKKADLPWHEEPVILKPSSNLVELVRRSQEQAKREPVENAAN